jgi:carbonic anhydrase
MRYLGRTAIALVMLGLLAANSGWGAGGTPCNASRPSTPADTLKALLDGNQRWVSGAAQHPGQDRERRQCVAKRQTPFAAVLSCSDSRVPPEALFDQGVGDLFVVRVAGNSHSDIGDQSLAYSVEHLGVKMILVLGHQDCGAVKAAVARYPAKSEVMLSDIYDAIAKAKQKVKSGDDKAMVSEAIDQHVLDEVEHLKRTAPFAARVMAGKLQIAGVRYDLDSGKVIILSEIK